MHTQLPSAPIVPWPGTTPVASGFAASGAAAGGAGAASAGLDSAGAAAGGAGAPPVMGVAAPSPFCLMASSLNLACVFSAVGLMEKTMPWPQLGDSVVLGQELKDNGITNRDIVQLLRRRGGSSISSLGDGLGNCDLLVDGGSLSASSGVRPDDDNLGLVSLGDSLKALESFEACETLVSLCCGYVYCGHLRHLGHGVISSFGLSKVKEAGQSHGRKGGQGQTG
ncbi:hypothetical protein HG530_001011 [Fusarium avenaceum]|nr:hypothetical protein HG530_001011 [Fusarium avenaceum]